VGAPGSDTDLQCRPTGWAESWAQNCGGGEMILAAAWLLKPWWRPRRDINDGDEAVAVW